MFLCILDGYLKDTALDGPGEDNSWNKFNDIHWKSKTLQDTPAKLCSSFFLDLNQNNAGPVCITILPSR